MTSPTGYNFLCSVYSFIGYTQKSYFDVSSTVNCRFWNLCTFSIFLLLVLFLILPFINFRHYFCFLLLITNKTFAMILYVGAAIGRLQYLVLSLRLLMRYTKYDTIWQHKQQFNDRLCTLLIIVFLHVITVWVLFDSFLTIPICYWKDFPTKVLWWWTPFTKCFVM